MSIDSAQEERILDSLDQLSPEGRRKALRRLLPTAAWLERSVESNRPRVEALAHARGLHWNSLTEEQREQLIDDVLHE